MQITLQEMHLPLWAQVQGILPAVLQAGRAQICSCIAGSSGCPSTYGCSGSQRSWPIGAHLRGACQQSLRLCQVFHLVHHPLERERRDLCLVGWSGVGGEEGVVETWS